jgi:hypothetical protein
MAINREARLREVLAEVNMLALWAATKSIFAQWGCFSLWQPSLGKSPHS